MKTKNSLLVVIDTCVIKSASETEHPVSSSCRQILLDVLEVCHRVILTNSIQVEWNRHMSRFSRKWIHSMFARKKIIRNVLPSNIEFDMIGVAKSDYGIIKKDWGLIEAALETDRVIITQDDEFKKRLAKTPNGLKIVDSILWINPVTDGIEKII